MKEDEKIEKFIRESLKYDKAPEDFSDKIMERIVASEKKEEMAFSTVVYKYGVERAPADFTSKVMSQLQKAPSIVTNPVIIGKKAWMVIVALVSAFVYYVISSAEPGTAETAAYADFMEKVGERFSQAGGSVNAQLPEILTNPVFALSLFALSSMLLLDYVVKRRKLSVI
jgi:hypothetical protein